jgi:dTMP kinase
MSMPVIVLEGLNGSGKSSVMVLLTEMLADKGYAVDAYRDPGSTAIGEELRSMLKRPEVHLCPMTQMLMFTAARVQLIHEHLLDSLKAGRIVILDRWWMSTYAYQSIEGVPSDLIVTTNARVSDFRTEKELSFLLDVSPKVAMRRSANMSGEGFKDRFEMQGLPFQQKLREAYTELVPTYLTALDAEVFCAETLAEHIVAAVDARIARGI